MAKPAQDIRDQVQAENPGATVVERGRSFLRHQKVDSSFILDVSLGPIHKADNVTEINTDLQPGGVEQSPWLWYQEGADYHSFVMPGNDSFNSGQIYKYVDEASGGEIAFQPQALQWTNDLNQLDQISTPQNVSGAVNVDVVTWPQAYGVDTQFEIYMQPGRLQKRLVLDSAPADPAQFVIDGGNPQLLIPFIFQSDLDIWINGVLWDKKSNNPQSTNAVVEFKDGDTTVFVFAPAWVVDQGRSEVQTTPTYRFRKSGNSLFVEILVDYSWLQQATYPVIIDPTVDIPIADANDDFSEDGGGGPQNTGSLAFSKEFSYDHHWMKFRWDLTITGDVTFSNCYMSLGNLSWLGNAMDARIWAEDTSTPNGYTGGINAISGRPKRAASVDWSATVASDVYSDSEDISTVVQDHYDAYGPYGGYNLAFIWEYQSSTGSTGVAHYEWGSNIPRLHLEYAAGGPPPIDIDATTAEVLAEGQAATVTVDQPEIDVSATTADLLIEGPAVTVTVTPPPIDVNATTAEVLIEGPPVSVTREVLVNVTTAEVLLEPQTVTVTQDVSPVTVTATTADTLIEPQAVTVVLEVLIDAATAETLIEPQAVNVVLDEPGINVNATTAETLIEPQTVAVISGPITVTATTAEVLLEPQAVTVGAWGQARKKRRLTARPRATALTSAVRDFRLTSGE